MGSRHLSHGLRETWGRGHMHTEDSYPSLPTHVPRLCLHLTFLHGDGGLLLPQSQQDEEEDKWDEDLKSQDPLERVDHMRLCECSLSTACPGLDMRNMCWPGFSWSPRRTSPAMCTQEP